MTEPEQISVKVGVHECQFVPPDELRFYMRGQFNESHVQPYLDFFFGQFERVNRQFYCVYDLSEFTGITAGARHSAVKVQRPYPFAALAVVGAKFSMRTLASMILTAGRLLAPSHYTFPVNFFDDHALAAVWFNELRNQRRI